MFVDRFFDRGDLAVQTIAGKTCAASCHLLHRTVKKNRCNSTTGRSISDPHLSGSKESISFRFESGNHLDPRLDPFHCFFSCHCRFFDHISGTHGNFEICRDFGIYRHSNIHRINICSALTAHRAGRSIACQEILCNDRGHFLSCLCHAFLYHTVVCTHRNQGTFLKVHIRASCDARDLNDQIFHLSKRMQWFSDTVPSLSGNFHCFFIQWMNLLKCFF